MSQQTQYLTLLLVLIRRCFDKCNGLIMIETCKVIYECKIRVQCCFNMDVNLKINICKHNSPSCSDAEHSLANY